MTHTVRCLGVGCARLDSTWAWLRVSTGYADASFKPLHRLLFAHSADVCVRVWHAASALCGRCKIAGVRKCWHVHVVTAVFCVTCSMATTPTRPAACRRCASLCRPTPSGALAAIVAPSDPDMWLQLYSACQHSHLYVCARCGSVITYDHTFPLKCSLFLPLHLAYGCRVVYDRGFVRGFSTMGTPVRPGMSRVFGRFSFGSFKPSTGKKPLMQELMTRLPHWVFIRNTLPDQDTVVNVKQVRWDQRQACAGTTRLAPWS